VLKLKKDKISPFYYIRDTILLSNGRKFRIRESTKRTSYEDAKAYSVRREKEILEELERQQSKRTFLDFNMAVLDYINSKTTIHKNDADRIDKLLKYFDNTEVNLINGYAFSGFVKSVIPKVKNDTVNRYRSNLVAVLNHAHGEQPHITINKIPTRKTEKPKPRYLSKEEAERLINAYNPILQPLIYFLAYQGARTAEALSLKWEDIDMDKRRVTLWNTKNGDYRSLPIHSRVYEALRGINRERSGFVFLTPSGKPYSYTSKKNGSPIKTAHKAALKRANIQQFKVHNWRSHWASRLVLDADATNYSLMALGGWRSPASVVHYINLNPDHLVNTLEKLE
tara:strand:- start:6268 stop:7284 length:1017 start_codon:yes stop_codon:yes gene_type:complete